MRYTNDRLYTPEEAWAHAEKDAREEFSGPWWYDVRWSDGGTAAEAVWADTAEDLAAIESGAWLDATEAHLPRAERADLVEADSFPEAVVYVVYTLDVWAGGSDGFDVEAIAEELFVPVDVYDARGDLRDRRYVIPPERGGSDAFLKVALRPMADDREE